MRVSTVWITITPLCPSVTCLQATLEPVYQPRLTAMFWWTSILLSGPLLIILNFTHYEYSADHKNFALSLYVFIFMKLQIGNRSIAL